MAEQLSLFAVKSPPLRVTLCHRICVIVSGAGSDERVATLPLQPFQFGQYGGKRRVASFGFRYDYALRRLQEANPIPQWLTPLIDRVAEFGGSDTRIAQVLCTEYDVGVGIGWHRDKPHFDRIFGLSLGSVV